MSIDIAQLVDIVIAITLVEFAALVAYHRRTGTGVALRDFALNTVSGLCLLLALRCLARDTGAAWVAGCLLASGAAHGTDLLMRWRRSARGASISRRVIA